ncbi:hypothetical protein GCM10019060_29420 [Novosphingobium pokkalii]|nr:hypothetical protein GCM10019060_29420 [Novosphingobium pokkalii]
MHAGEIMGFDRYVERLALLGEDARIEMRIDPVTIGEHRFGIRVDIGWRRGNGRGGSWLRGSLGGRRGCCGTCLLVLSQERTDLRHGEGRDLDFVSHHLSNLIRRR